MVRTAFLAFVVFGLGIALGFALGYSATRREVQPQEPGAPELIRNEPEPAEAAPVAEPIRRPVTEHIAPVPVPAVERGEGSIHGHVRTESGEPLAGVLVRAYRITDSTEGPRRQYRTLEEPSLDEMARDFIEEERRRRAGRSEARSGDDGSFVISDLVESARYWIEALRNGYVVSVQDPRGGGTVRAGDRLDLLARAEVEVRVSVLLPDGTEAPRARVHLRGSSRGDYLDRRDWSRDHATLLLLEGGYLLKATHGQDEELVSQEEELVLDAGAPPQAVVLSLKERPGIRGQVLMDPADEFRRAQVHLQRVQFGSPADTKRLCENPRSYSVEADSGYAFADLLPGAYLLGVSRGGGRILAADVVEVANGMVTRDLALPPPQRSDYVILRVFGPQGAAPPTLEISTGLRIENGGSAAGGGGEVRRADGSYLVPHLEWCGHGEGGDAINSISVRAKGFPERTVEYRRSETLDLEVRLAEPATLEVELAGFAPQAYEGTFGLAIEEALKVRIEEGGDAGAMEQMRRFESGGSFHAEEEGLKLGRGRFGPLWPGAYRLVLSYRAGGGGDFPVQTLAVELRSGRNQVQMTVPRLFPMRLLVSGPGRNRRVDLSPVQTPEPSGSWSLSQEVGEDGLVFFDGLPAGSYKVSLRGDEPSDMLVQVPAQGDVRFQARRHDAMLVRVDDPEGGLARAGFVTGDLIVSLDGAAFESRTEWWTLLEKAYQKKQVKVVVQRADGLLEISLRPRDLSDGGMLEPASR